MNNVQELIEDLKSIILYFSRNHEGLLYVAYAATIQQAITALESMQAPLPDDVTAMIDYQNSVALVYGNERDRGIGDMLERLAYENQCHILARKQDKQRIEKLEEQHAVAYRVVNGDAKTNAEQEIEIDSLTKENKRLNAALYESKDMYASLHNEKSYWKGKAADLQQRIKELE
jgi:predicted RNase H-like nuclease (RuvC/YqgF family)